MKITTTAGGFLVACECGWERWYIARSVAETCGRVHEGKCRG